MSKEDIAAAKDEVNNVFVHRDLYGYITDIVEYTRFRSGVVLGASTRSCIALLKSAKARTALNNQSYVLPDDIKAVAVPVLAHRLVLQPSLNIKRDSAANIIKNIINEVKFPTEDFDKYKL